MSEYDERAITRIAVNVHGRPDTTSKQICHLAPFV